MERIFSGLNRTLDLAASDRTRSANSREWAPEDLAGAEPIQVNTTNLRRMCQRPPTSWHQIKNTRKTVSSYQFIRLLVQRTGCSGFPRSTFRFRPDHSPQLTLSGSSFPILLCSADMLGLTGQLNQSACPPPSLCGRKLVYLSIKTLGAFSRCAADVKIDRHGRNLRREKSSSDLMQDEWNSAALHGRPDRAENRSTNAPWWNV